MIINEVIRRPDGFTLQPIQARAHHTQNMLINEVMIQVYASTWQYNEVIDQMYASTWQALLGY